MYEKEKTYIVSDLHLFHKNIIKYCPASRGVFTDDILSPTMDDILSMNEYILKQIDGLPAGSTLINCGDVFMSYKLKFDECQAIIQRMKQNGKYLELILGNHDRDFHKILKKFSSAEECFREMGFDNIEPYGSNVVYDKFRLSHEPIPVPEGADYINLYGHTHDKDITPDYFMHKENRYYGEIGIVNTKKYFNVCWDKHMRPLSILTLCSRSF